ncbi:MAG: phosphoribosyltransferase family protein, partial [Patescibacteria group bacterium]
DFDYLCRKCFGKIDLKSTLECIGCKRQTQYGLTCVFCKKNGFIDQLLIATDLSNPLVDRILKTYKYEFITDLANPLSVILEKFVRKLASKGINIFEDNPLVVPVPLHKRRLNWRGFNQAQLLAETVADSFLVSCGEDVLLRVGHSKNQADTNSKEERFKNIRGQFVVQKKEVIKNRTIILVDDICTSGATLNECARVLKENGAKRVIGFVVARG